MRDPRALRNLDNLNSYRAWEREGLRRSGFSAMFLVVALSVPFFTMATSQIEHWARDARSVAVLTGGVLLLYMLAVVGLMVFAVFRMIAWKRAHPWEPPPERAFLRPGYYRVGTGGSLE
jgi:uncharacterized membrane protein